MAEATNLMAIADGLDPKVLEVYRQQLRLINQVLSEHSRRREHSSLDPFDNLEKGIHQSLLLLEEIIERLVGKIVR
jgi:uncharacterized protein YllA (UPF0747 family)